METEITAEQFYERMNKIQEETYKPDISEEHPLMICCNKQCNSKYTLPMPYEECNKLFRDYCPSCVIDIYETESERKL